MILFRMDKFSLVMKYIAIANLMVITNSSYPAHSKNTFLLESLDKFFGQILLLIRIVISR